jgi:DNA polymerase III sliding clamp (beta) subunit (PCNA family)
LSRQGYGGKESAMALVLERKHLVSAFNRAARVVPTRSIRPILDFVRLSVNGDGTLYATDCEMSVAVKLPATSEQECDCLLPAAKFGQIIRESTDECVTLKIDKPGRASVAGQSGRFEIATGVVAEYPSIEIWDGVGGAEVSGEWLASAVGKASIFCSEGSRYALNCVHIELSKDRIAVVASDSNAMVVFEVACKYRGKDISGLVTVRAAKAIAGMELSGPASIRLTPNRFEVKSGDVDFSALLHDGRFPRWQEVCSRPSNPNLTLESSTLAIATKQAAVACTVEAPGIDYQAKDGVLSMSAAHSAECSSAVQVPIPSESDSWSARLDHKYVLDFARTVAGGSQINISADGRVSEPPVYFYGDDWTGVVMSMKRN